MIIKHFTDNDLYKFSVMLGIQRLFPWAYVSYTLIDRGHTSFPDGFAGELKKEVDAMSRLRLTKEEKTFITRHCYFFDPAFIDFLEGYQYDPNEVLISQEGGNLNVRIKGYWYRTVLWEVPLLAIISELYFKMMGIAPDRLRERTIEKAFGLRLMEAEFSDFGTRRRFSFDVQKEVVSYLKKYSSNFFKGTSNVYLAMKNNTTPIGTMPHEWFMFHGAIWGYRSATAKALEAWVEVYQGSLGIALSDTYTTGVFYDSFSLKQAKLFDGVRWDSGDPFEFTDKTIEFYKKNRIDPMSKTIVFSDSLDMKKVREIKSYVNNRIHDVYGIGTYFSNDVGATPLNTVIKLNSVRYDKKHTLLHAVKLSDDVTKQTGDPDEIRLSRRTLGIVK